MTTDNETTNSSVSEQEKKIKYGLKFALPNDWKPKEISFDLVNKIKFNQCTFNEFLIKPEYVHLYYDFDSISSEEEYLDVLTWLDEVKGVFGDYSIGGYSNDQDFSNKYGFRYIDGDKHYLSIHVVYYTSKILSTELMEIMKHTDKKGYVNYKVHKLCDPNVYKLDSRQVFRHVLSDKCYSEKNPKNRKNHGYILNGLKPVTQIVQVRGNEKTITRDQWESVFPPLQIETNEIPPMDDQILNQILDQTDDQINDPEMVKTLEETLPQKPANPGPKTRKKRVVKGKRIEKIDDLELDDELILFTEEEMTEFLDHFDPEFDNLFKTLAPLRYSPYSKEFLREILIRWYGRRKHTNGTVNVVDQILKYHAKENNNRWFFSIVKHLPEEVRKQYLTKYTKSIDFTININNSDWSFEDINLKEYSIWDTVSLINDLRGVVGVIEDIWYLKKRIDGQFFIKEISDDKLMKKMKNYKPFCKNHIINLAQILSRYSKLFVYSEARICKEVDNEDGKNMVINMFQGFKHKEVFSDDFTPLQPLLDHIREVICKNNDKKYDYFMRWWASIIQNITVKNGTMPIIHGAQGSGKSFPIELLCELFGKYALANVDDLDKVFGKFNGLIGRHLVININEPPEANEKFKYLGKIKSKLTQKKTVQETKGVDQIEIDSWANYSMTTNNPNPVQEEKGDRRLIYFETDNKYCGNTEYFKSLCSPFQPAKQGDYNPYMMGLLLHYMKTQIDTNNWDPETLIREINADVNAEYNENLERQYLDLNAVDRYVVDHYDVFAEGTVLDDIRIDGYKPNGIARKLTAICDVCRKRIDGRQLRVYTLKSKEQIPDLYAIIDYMKKFAVETQTLEQILNE